MSDSYGDGGAGNIDQMVQALMKDPQMEQQYQGLMQMQQPSSMASGSNVLGNEMNASKHNFMNPMGGMLGPVSGGLLSALKNGSPGGLVQGLQGLFNPNSPSTPASSPTGQMPPIQ